MNASINSSSRQRPMSSAGFTLIELMVTIAVLAIIVSIAAPNISTQLANQRVKSTTTTIESALKEAKAESLIRRQSLTLTYDESSKPKVIEIKNLSSNVIASYNYDAKTSIKSTLSEITFEPTKRVDTAVTYTICDEKSVASPRQLVVDKIANISSQAGGTC